MIRKFLPSLAVLAGLCFAAPASAQPLIRLDVVDRDSGRWLPEYRDRRDTWIAGTPSHRYGVRLTNTTGARMLVVLSIDGINAVTGETAHPTQTGYVLAPYQSTEITGWRKSYRDVAQFVFTALPDSYAARTGRWDNVGTIGIAVFRERGTYVYPLPAPPIASGRDSRKPGGEARAAEQEVQSADADEGIAHQRIGTGHGQRESSPVGQTSFVRASGRPDQLTQLRYDSPAALAARGILPRPPHPRHRDRPQAFPGSFVPDPPADGY